MHIRTTQRERIGNQLSTCKTLRVCFFPFLLSGNRRRAAFQLGPCSSCQERWPETQKICSPVFAVILAVSRASEFLPNGEQHTVYHRTPFTTEDMIKCEKIPLSLQYPLSFISLGCQKAIQYLVAASPRQRSHLTHRYLVAFGCGLRLVLN